MRLAYFDCFSGISGDMALGALVHAGADLDRITAALETLPVDGFLLEREEVEDHGIVATRMHVKTRPQGLIRTYASVRVMLESSELPAAARRNAGRMFHRLAAGLGKVHGKEPELITFHELGEIETIVEVVGVSLALDFLGIERVFSSPIPTGMGMAHHEHGLVPIPSAEVLELLQAVPTYTRGTPVELVSPVGAAIVATVVEGFGDMPLMRTDRTGYGAGHPRLDFPNLLRVVVGEEEPAWRRAEAPPRGDPAFDHPSAAAKRLASVPALEASEDEPTELLIQSTVADPGPGDRAGLLEALFDAGATDAWAATVLTRHGEALRVSAVCPPGAETALAEAMRSAGAAHVRVAVAGRPPNS